MEKNLKIDQVPGSDYKIIQNREKFSYGIDAILLSEFTKAKGKLVDLGTGTAIIPLRILARQKVEKIYGVEIQEEVAKLAKKSLELNQIDKIEILNMDLKNLDRVIKKHTIDVVTSNPPYIKLGKGIVNEDENFALSRHEINCNIEDIIRTADYLLKPLGRLFLVHRPDRLVDILYYLRTYNIEAKYIQFVQPRIDRPANLVLIEARKDSRPYLNFLKNLIVYNKDGSYTEDIKKIYYRSCKNEG